MEFFSAKKVIIAPQGNKNLGKNNRKHKNLRPWNVADIDTWMEMISKNVSINSASFKNKFGCDIKRSNIFDKIL
jgi:hypothetical protein